LSSKIKFAVVGMGHIGKRHAEMIKRNDEAELVAICDIKPKEELGLENFDVPFFTDIDVMLDAGIEFDVLCVATPNYWHCRHSFKGLKKNKHIVCEKPMALTKAQCEVVMATAKEVNKHVFCVLQNRYSPPSVWIKDVVSKNILGDIYMVHLNCFWNRDNRYYKKEGWKGTLELDGGTLFTQFSHFVDIMYWLFGDIKNIQARFYDFNHKGLTEFEDSGTVTFDFVNGGMGTINYSTSLWDVNMESSITIIGSKGSVKIGGQYMNSVDYCHIENYSMPELPPVSHANDYGHYKGSAANHHFIFENVVDVLKGRAEVETSANEGSKVVDIIERIYSLKETVNKTE